MKLTTFSTIALGLASLTVGQFVTTITSVYCINPKYCSTRTYVQSIGAATPTVVAPRCEPGKFGPGCFPIITHPPGNAIHARQAEPTPAAIAPRCEPGMFGPGCFPIIHPPANAVEAREDMSTSCFPGRIGPDCHMCIPGRNEPGCPPSPWPPADVAITPAPVESYNPPPSPVPTATTSHFGCPGGKCGPGCRWGHECDMMFGRGVTQDLGGRSQRGVKREAEATAVAEAVHSTLLTLRA
ncbi:hypothetical protein ACET3X_006273 [Alternaria dauci]|uniref:Uncharacterized protein n=1 Tax=Alternaria dauci TaxID=48095 RepID=A0ABR3UJL9_9PLEO